MNENPTDPLSSAATHAALGLPQAAQRSLAKRVVVRLTAFFVEPQRAYNQGVVDAVQILRTGHDHLGDRLAVHEDSSQAEAAATRSDLTRLQLALADNEVVAGLTRGQVGEFAAALQRLEGRIAALDAALTQVRDEQAARLRHDRSQDSLVGLFLREARRRHPEPPDDDRLRALPDPDRELDRAIEEAFAGSFDDVQARRSVYLSDVAPLAGHGRLLDIRPGRGEWLELLARAGVPAYGVDPDAGVVAAGRERGLDIVHADVLGHLASVPDGSLAAVTGFHIAERLGFRGLVELADQAARALRPGGLLLLETPNPANLVVGASARRSPPGGGRSLHPEVLDFVLAARGFADVELRFLHPDPACLEWAPDAHDFAVKPLEPVVQRLNDLLFGPQDVAVLGRRLDD